MERLKRHIGTAPPPALLVGAGTLLWAVAMLTVHRPDSRTLLAIVFLALFAAIDTLVQRIPNSLTISVMCGGLGIAFLEAGLSGVGVALVGVLLGGGLLLPFYLAGAVGAGDVKGLAAAGALLGPWPLLQIALWGGLIGGVVSLFYLAAGRLRADWALRAFPYAPVMALATMAWVTWGRILPL